MDNKPKILLIGGGGHCRSVIDVIEQENKYIIIGIIDKKELIGSKVLNYEIIGCDEDLEKLFETYKYAVITVGQIKSNKIRVKLFNIVKSIGYKLPIIISPRAYLSKYAKVDEGTVLMHDSLININAQIGKNCIINTKALVEHDAIVKDNCHISTGSIINGGVIVQKDSFVGSGAVSKEYIRISGFNKARSLIV